MIDTIMFYSINTLQSYNAISQRLRELHYLQNTTLIEVMLIVPVIVRLIKRSYHCLGCHISSNINSFSRVIIEITKLALLVSHLLRSGSIIYYVTTIEIKT